MRRSRSESGIYLVMTVAFIVVLLLLAAWVIGIGIMTTNEARLQRIGNLVALAALEDFAQRPAATPYIDRANSALARANEVLDDNRLPFIQSFEDVGHAGASSPGGDLTLGRWFREDDGTGPCGGNPAAYPCFVANPPPGPGMTNAVDAVRIDLRTGSGGNPLEYIFCGLFNTCNTAQGIDSTAFSSIIQRCTVFVSDVSASTFYSTHKRNARGALGKGVAAEWDLIDGCAGPNSLDSWDDHAVCAVRNPADSPPAQNAKVDISLPFLRYSEAGNLVIGANGDFACDRLNAYFTPPGSLERFYWCNMNRNPRNDPARPYQRPDPPGVVDPVIHFRNDYIRRQIMDVNGVPFWLWVDSFVDDSTQSQYEGPQPFTSYLKAFNAGLRSLNQVKTATDQAALIALNGTIKGRYPPPTPPALPQLSSNFGIMTQIMNAENRGTVTWDHNLDGTPDPYTPEVRPNFLDFGFYSLLFQDREEPDQNTNLILGLNEAINTLSANCPVSAQRMIVLATDGVTSCRVKPGRPIHTLDYTDYDCNAGNFQYYLDSEPQLADLANTESVLSRLIQSQIGVIALVAGDHISPNFNNYYHNGNPVDISEMYARGLGSGYNGGGGGFNIDPICPSPPCSEADVFDNLGREGYALPRPLAVLGDLSVMSGGLMCPLMPPCNFGMCSGAGCDNAGSCPTCCYEKDPSNPSGPCRLKAAYRPQGSAQRCSIYQLSIGEQAAKCVVDGLGASPYILVAPEQIPPA